MSDPINEMFPSGGGMRGGPALVCITYDSNGNPCGISGLPDFAENYVEAIAAERDRLAVLSEEWRVECLKQNEALSAALERAEQAEARILAALDMTPDPRVTALVEAANTSRLALREIAGMDLIGASAVAYNAARELEAAIAAFRGADNG